MREAGRETGPVGNSDEEDWRRTTHLAAIMTSTRCPLHQPDVTRGAAS